MMRGVRIKRISLRTRIFMSMILLTLIASILMASISVYQFRKEAKVYHQERLEHKENAITEHINYVLSTTTYPLTADNLPLIFKDKIHELADIHSLQINIYSLKGKLLKSSKAYFLSSYITHSLKLILEKLKATRLNQKNERIELDDTNREISLLIKAYNAMVDKLEDSASKLAQSEREQAWRDMAKQVAHEIKNPLTPMRLTVQSFERKFDPNSPDIIQKMKDYSETLIQQIDTMSSVASAFSNFASMPAQQNETLNVVTVVELALEIFNKEYIKFQSEEAEIITKMDRTQLIRIITNLVKNAIQAIPESQSNKEVLISVKREVDQ